MENFSGYLLDVFAISVILDKATNIRIVEKFKLF